MRWIIGDIHGMLRPLQTLLDAVFTRDHDANIIFVGDYVNRGPDSKGVIDLLLNLPRDHARFCRGNHDDIFDLLLNGKSYAAGADPLPVFAWFLAHGLDRTLHSYGIDMAMIESVEHRPTPQRLEALIDPVPPEHRKFFRYLPLAIEDDDLFVIHAVWNPSESDRRPNLITPIMQGAKLKHQVLWERFSDRELNGQKVWQRRGFFGHTPVLNYSLTEDNVPIVAPRAVLLDTGVALSPVGRLTAFCAETDEYIQTDHYGLIVPPPHERQ